MQLKQSSEGVALLLFDKAVPVRLTAGRMSFQSGDPKMANKMLSSPRRTDKNEHRVQESRSVKVAKSVGT